MEVTLTDFLNQLKAITMEKEKTENLIKIMQAFLKGEVVEQRALLSEIHSPSWFKHVGNDWNTIEYEYRIKPKPQYRPFKSAEECWQEMLKHQPFGYIHFADDNLYHNIIMLASEQGCQEAHIRIGNCTVRGLNEAFHICTFADGTPFGIKDNIPKKSKS